MIPSIFVSIATFTASDMAPDCEAPTCSSLALMARTLPPCVARALRTSPLPAACSARAERSGCWSCSPAPPSPGASSAGETAQPRLLLSELLLILLFVELLLQIERIENGARVVDHRRGIERGRFRRDQRLAGESLLDPIENMARNSEVAVAVIATINNDPRCLAHTGCA